MKSSKANLNAKKKAPQKNKSQKQNNNGFMNTKEKNYINFMHEKALRKQKSLFDYSKIFLTEEEFKQNEIQKQQIKEDRQKKYLEKMEKMAEEENLDLEMLMTQQQQQNLPKKEKKEVFQTTNSLKTSRVCANFYSLKEEDHLFLDFLIEEVYEKCLMEKDLDFLEKYDFKILMKLFKHKKSEHLLRTHHFARKFLMKKSLIFDTNFLSDFINKNHELFVFSEEEILQTEFNQNFFYSDLGIEIACCIILNDYALSNLFINFDEEILFKNKKNEQRIWGLLNLIFKYSTNKIQIIKNLKKTITNCSEERKPFMMAFLRESGLKK